VTGDAVLRARRPFAVDITPRELLPKGQTEPGWRHTGSQGG
jgi:hypothetical protein